MFISKTRVPNLKYLSYFSSKRLIWYRLIGVSIKKYTIILFYSKGNVIISLYVNNINNKKKQKFRSTVMSNYRSFTDLLM